MSICPSTPGTSVPLRVFQLGGSNTPTLFLHIFALGDTYLYVILIIFGWDYVVICVVMIIQVYAFKAFKLYLLLLLKHLSRYRRFAVILCNARHLSCCD